MQHLIIYLIIYLCGASIWMFIEERYLPYKEGEYTIEFDGAHKITEEDHIENAVVRCALWPFCLAVIIFLVLPVTLLKILFKKY